MAVDFEANTTVVEGSKRVVSYINRCLWCSHRLSRLSHATVRRLSAGSDDKSFSNENDRS